jgi:hypothetical protein
MPALETPIRTLPCTDGNQDVLVDIEQMTWEHVNLWHTFVQPLINLGFQHWHAGLPAQDARADVGWDWALNYALVLLHNSATYIPGNKSGLARALTLAVTTTGGDQIPIGMLTVVPRFRCDVGGAVQDRTFAWYLADAPKVFYTDVLKVVPVKGVATALLDCAIQTGFDAGQSGETLLHADPNGGEKLTNFYLTHCLMRQVELKTTALFPSCAARMRISIS